MEQSRATEPGRYQVGISRFREALATARRANLRPPPKLTLSQWAERYAYLSPETSAETGRFRAFPYQVGIMDAVTDPSVETITVKKSARVGYTKILDHIVGYFIHQDPSPVLVIQPRDEDAEDYSATEIEPMLRDTPVLAEIAGDPKARSSKQKLKKRLFRNGASVAFASAVSPAGLRRITARIILFDEVDGYPVKGAGKEGDQLKLGARRSLSFWNRKIVIGSTPTEEGASRIDRSYELSDKRRFLVPCPHCGEEQTLEWGGKDVPFGIKWDRAEDGEPLPETAHYVCRLNGCIIEEVDKPAMIAGGCWVATAPFKGHAGFHISALYSLFPNAAWSKLAAEWVEVAADPLERQTFINLVLGEVYADRGLNALNEGYLLARREVFAAEVPDGVAIVTIGVDIQNDRIEAEVVGWGRDEESWSIDHEVFSGDPADPEVWAQLDEYLKRRWYRADGRPFAAEAVCLDTGGAHTEAAYQFCKARLTRKIWGIKGESAQGGMRNPVWPTKTPSHRTRKTYRPIILGVNAAKDAVRVSLKVASPGPRYMHFPADRELGWFQQLIAEKAVLTIVGNNKFYKWVCPPGRANEALDCRVYALGALKGLQHRGVKLNKRADQVGAAHVVHDAAEPLQADEMNAVTTIPAAGAGAQVRKPGTPAPGAVTAPAEISVAPLGAAPPSAPASARVPAAHRAPSNAAAAAAATKTKAERLAERLSRMK